MNFNKKNDNSLFIILSLVILLITFFITGQILDYISNSLKKKEIQQFKKEVFYVSQGAKSNITSFFDGILFDLEYFSKLKCIQNNTPFGKGLLKSYYETGKLKHLKKIRFFSSISLVNPKGDILYSTTEKFIGLNLAPYTFFKFTRSKKVPFISGATTILSGEKVLALTYPVIVNSKLKSIIVVSIPFKNFNRVFFAGLNFKEKSDFFILDRNKTVIASNDTMQIGQNFFEVPKNYAKYNKIFNILQSSLFPVKPFLLNDLTGEQDLYVFLETMRIRRTLWSLIFSMPQKALMSELNDFKNKAALSRYFILGFLLLLFVLVVYRERKFNKILLEKEKIFKLTSETSGQIVYFYDAKNDKLTFFCNVEKLLGYPNDKFTEIPQKQIVEYIHPDDMENFEKQFQKAIEKKRPVLIREYRFKHANDRYFEMEESSSLIYDKNGKLSLMVGTLRDITLRKLHEQQLEIYKNRLEEIVSERTKALEETLEKLREEIEVRKQKEEELQKALKKVEASDKLKSEFLAQISHEIRTPINAIVGHISILQMEFEDSEDEMIVSALNAISAGGQRIIRTVELILNMAELQVGSYEPTYKKWDVFNLILKRVYLEYRPQALVKKLEIKLEECVCNAEEIVDEYSVRQIFANLIDNAIKYTEQGEINIRLYRNEKNKLVFEISDTGIGIDKEYLPYLYEPFSQEEQGYTRKFEGNGLGLALVKLYADLNNIEINVETEKNKGTKFTLIFNGVKLS